MNDFCTDKERMAKFMSAQKSRKFAFDNYDIK